MKSNNIKTNSAPLFFLTVKHLKLIRGDIARISAADILGLLVILLEILNIQGNRLVDSYCL